MNGANFVTWLACSVPISLSLWLPWARQKVTGLCRATIALSSVGCPFKGLLRKYIRSRALGKFVSFVLTLAFSSTVHLINQTVFKRRLLNRDSSRCNSTSSSSSSPHLPSPSPHPSNQSTLVSLATPPPEASSPSSPTATPAPTAPSSASPPAASLTATKI